MSYKKKWQTIMIVSCFFVTLLCADDHRDLMKDRIGEDEIKEAVVAESNEVILAEFDNGVITKKELEERIQNLPPIHQPRFQSPEAKADLLKQLAIENILYQEALAMNMDEDEEYKRRLETNTISYFSREFRTDFLQKNLTFSEEEKQAYYAENSDTFKAQTYEEAEPTILRYLRPAKERDLIEKLASDLMEKYQVKIVDEVLEQLHLEDIKDNEKMKDEKIITANEPELEMTSGEFIALFTENPNYKSVPLNSVDDLKKIIDTTLESSLLAFEAKQQGFYNNSERKNMLDRIQTNMLLQTTYNRLVVDKIDVSEQALRKYYDDNIAEFSTLAYRTIQEFVFDDEKTAKKILKSVKKAGKDEEKINAYVLNYSKNTKNNGHLPNIYKNDIIPGLGKDAPYSKVVWETSPNKWSKIFQNRRNEYVFFRIIEDVEAVATPFEEARESIKQTKYKNEQTSLFEELQDELSTKYNLKLYPDKLIVKLTAKEYFTKAEDSQKRRRFRDAIYYYDQIIKFYPNQQDDYKALFMKGFILAENLNEKEDALAVFEKVLNDYPENELHESARFMKNELTGKSESLKIFEE